eukprot:CAMPEP_0206126104 /NCGR_PEP_ID=MMETSP1472-20131121/20718_1 /ASSEMBLY_ACC=CAM_ASM_001108 /TAXON_ID=41880 /ORGANISM="Pycnococcus provasolii, Strain RCC251" /LENGTH=43 /DNA_ID= /DNA_START= /DNA_END= /DNA_ORIENTATION=
MIARLGANGREVRTEGESATWSPLNLHVDQRPGPDHLIDQAID